MQGSNRPREVTRFGGVTFRGWRVSSVSGEGRDSHTVPQLWNVKSCRRRSTEFMTTCRLESWERERRAVRCGGLEGRLSFISPERSEACGVVGIRQLGRRAIWSGYPQGRTLGICDRKCWWCGFDACWWSTVQEASRQTLPRCCHQQAIIDHQQSPRLGTTRKWKLAPVGSTA